MGRSLPFDSVLDQSEIRRPLAVFSELSEDIDFKTDLVLMADKALAFANQSTTYQNVSFRSLCSDLQPVSKL